MSNDGRTWTLGALAALAAAAALKNTVSGSPSRRTNGSRAKADEQDEMPDALRQMMSGRAVAQQRGVKLTQAQAADARALADRAQLAYGWITEHAVYSPVGDMEFGARPKNPVAWKTPAVKTQGIWLTDLAGGGEAYSSFVLLPLLNLFAQRRALLVGGPGRSKTTIAFILGAIAGMDADEMKKYVVRGHPQLTVADMVGAPLPAGMMQAKTSKQVPIQWRNWIDARVKIIDEYNRIPTKTQSALLSLMAEGYTEQFDQYKKTVSQQEIVDQHGETKVVKGRKSGKYGGSWFLTANDDGGGGTFEVIQALKDRIDIVVRAVAFHSGFVNDLLQRIERGDKPEEMIPEDIMFSVKELDLVADYINTAIKVPPEIADRLGFFMGQLDFCRRASPNLEAMNKDTLKLAGVALSSVCNDKCPLTKVEHLCTQTETGLSARTFETVLRFSKTLAWFRGHEAVSWEDVTQILPWTIRDKLQVNTKSEFFTAAGTDNDDAERRARLITDKTAWIQNMIQMADEKWASGQVKQLRTEVHAITAEARVASDRNQLKRLSIADLEKAGENVRKKLTDVMSKAEFSGWIYEDVLDLKRTFQTYQNLIRTKKKSG